MEILTASKVSTVVKEGYQRLEQFRKSRVMFIRDYMSQYMLEQHGLTGEKPINLVFLAVRTLVPNLVMKNPVNKVTTKILAYKDYAELLGLGLNELQEQLRMKTILRAACVDMCFGLAVLKTSIKASGMLMPLEPDVDVDPGQIYTDIISGDDLVFDPVCRQLDKAEFIGHRLQIPRQKLLDADGWEHDLVKRLPASLNQPNENKRAEDISKADSKGTEMKALQDYVDIVELWFPEADTIAYIPDPFQADFSEFLKIQDYYGPKAGPYSFGSLTPPVPDNPLPVAPVGVWRDIGDMANNLFKKLMDQADITKDILLYTPRMADVAEEIRTARNNDAIACSNPKEVNLVSFGTQNPNVDRMINSLSYWWNILSGNPMQMGGMVGGGKTDTATEFQGLQGNLSVGLNDMRDIVHDLAADSSAKQAWYMIHDPLIEMPLFKRTTGGKEIQIYLTPEQRRGDWSNYNFDIVRRSMQAIDPLMRAKHIMDFYTNVVPSVAAAAIQMMQMGQEFNVSRALMQAAEELGIADSISEVFNDPAFQQRMQIYMQMGPKEPGKGMVSPGAVMQQGGFPGRRPVLTPGQETNQQAQFPAAEFQSAMRTI